MGAKHSAPPPSPPLPSPQLPARSGVEGIQEGRVLITENYRLQSAVGPVSVCGIPLSDVQRVYMTILSGQVVVWEASCAGRRLVIRKSRSHDYGPAKYEWGVLDEESADRPPYGSGLPREWMSFEIHVVADPVPPRLSKTSGGWVSHTGAYGPEFGRVSPKRVEGIRLTDLKGLYSEYENGRPVVQAWAARCGGEEIIIRLWYCSSSANSWSWEVFPHSEIEDIHRACAWRWSLDPDASWRREARAARAAAATAAAYLVPFEDGAPPESSAYLVPFEDGAVEGGGAQEVTTQSPGDAGDAGDGSFLLAM